MLRDPWSNRNRAPAALQLGHPQRRPQRRRPGYTVDECRHGPPGPWPRNNIWLNGRSNGYPQTCNKGNPLEDHRDQYCFDQHGNIIEHPNVRHTVIGAMHGGHHHHHHHHHHGPARHPHVRFDDGHMRDYRGVHSGDEDGSDSGSVSWSDIYERPSTSSLCGEFLRHHRPRYHHRRRHNPVMHSHHHHNGHRRRRGHGAGRVGGFFPMDPYRTHDSESTISDDSSY